MDLIVKRDYMVSMRECDMFGRMRPSLMFGLFQDISGLILDNLHAGVWETAQKGMMWVVARLGCEILRAPRCEENIRYVVWLGPARLGMYPWQYRLEDLQGNALVRGTAVWVMLDAETHTMLSGRVPRLQYEAPEPPAPPLERLSPLKLPPLTEHTERRVLFSETDLNGHLTNTRYMDWVCDLVEPSFHRDHPIRALRVDFRTESGLGQTVELSWKSEDDAFWCRGEGKFEALFKF